MLYALGIMLLGVIVGRLLRKRIKRPVFPIIFISCCSLLFIMGIKVGLNGMIMGNLSSIGLVSVILCLSAMAGSVALTVIFSGWMSEKRGKNES